MPTTPYADVMDAPSAAAPTSPFASAMDDYQRGKTVRMSATLDAAADTNPDQYAVQKRVAGYLGYPVAAVTATPEASQREATVKQAKADAAAHPALAQAYTDDDFARLASDDSMTLAGIGAQIRKAAKFVFSHPDAKVGTISALTAGVHDKSEGAAGMFRSIADFGASGVEALFPTIKFNEQNYVAGGNPLRRLSEGFGMSGQASKAKADVAAPASGDLLTDGVVSGLRSTASNVLGLPMAFLPGGQAAALTGMAAGPADSSYTRARQ